MAPDSAPPPPEALLSQILFGKIASMAVSAIAKLRVADLLADGPKSIDYLVSKTSTHPPSLYRVMRAVAGLGIFAEQPDGRFGLTQTGELLRTGVHGSMRGMAEYFGEPWSWQPWGNLLDSIRTGKTAFDTTFGEPIFDYLAKHPAESAVFNEAMTGFTSAIATAVVEAYNFSDFETIVDVGGGHGILVNTILASHPAAKGIVFDAPGVVAGAEVPIREAGLTSRCQAIGGDFFQNVPAGGDCYIMKHIIHDWPDEPASKILANCRKAVKPGGKLILVELVIRPGNEPDLGKLLDLEMLVIASGKERTEEEYRTLLAGAGWRLTRIISTKSPASVIEGVPV